MLHLVHTDISVSLRRDSFDTNQQEHVGMSTLVCEYIRTTQVKLIDKIATLKFAICVA